MVAGGLSPNQRKRLRRRLVRQVANDVAVLIAGTQTVNVDGNVCVPKPALVAALAGYFAEMSASRRLFIERAYGSRR